MSVGLPKIEHMFEVRELQGVPLRDALDVLLDARATRHAAEVQEAIAILHIVQNYHRDLPDNPMPGRGRLVELAAEGGPRLNEFVPLELSAALGVSQQTITLLISDLLDLEYRHPLLWQLVRQGSVPLWQARKIVARVSSAGLGLRAALELDRELSPTLTGLPFGRALKLLEGLIVAVDPRGAEERAETQRRSRWVRLHPQPDGVSWLEGRVNSADGRQFDLALNRIAAILKANGDTDDRENRRASALAILANPLLAVSLLQREALRRDSCDRAPAPPAPTPAAPTPADPTPADPAAAAPTPADPAVPIIDPRRLLPPATIFLHLSDEAVRTGRGVARVEGVGPVPVKQLRRLLKGNRVRVLPVFDPGGVTPVDSYEIPAPMRRAVILRHPTDVFAFGSCPSRGLDLDHTEPYRPGGEPGQTRVDNLGPLTRRQHRAKTHGGWQVEQLLPGRYLWRSPLGREYWNSGDGRTFPLPRTAHDPPPF